MIALKIMACHELFSAIISQTLSLPKIRPKRMKSGLETSLEWDTTRLETKNTDSIVYLSIFVHAVTMTKTGKPDSYWDHLK